jgi:hypothetical protein
MKRIACTFFVLFATSTLGCGMMVPHAPQGGGGGGDAQPDHSNYTIPKESQDTVRKQEQAAYARADDAEDEELDKQEKASLKALKIALGKESRSPGQPPGDSSSTALIGIKKAKMKVRLEPVVDGDGKAVNDDFFQLKDSFTDRVQQLQRKIVEQRASKAEMREIQEGSKQVMKLNDLRMAVMDVSLQTMMSNNHVQTASLQQMLRVAGLVRSRKLYNMKLDDSDYALVKHGLERQKRAEAIAATNLAMLAAYQAVINSNGDPKALDVIAEGALKAFPVKVEVSDADAKQYVEQLGTNVSKVKAKYEAMLRKVHGDARYEKQFKSSIDAMFAQAEGAQNQKSIGQTMNDTQSKYKTDVAKCMRGEQPDPGSMVGGGTCKSLQQAAQTGDTSDLPPGALKAFNDNGGASGGGGGAGGAGGGPGMPKGKAGAALEGAQAAANGDVDGVLDAAGKMFPGDSTIGASLQGIAALKRGDARGAISAALTFVPVPGLKDAFGLASKLLFKS